MRHMHGAMNNAAAYVYIKRKRGAHGFDAQRGMSLGNPECSLT